MENLKWPENEKDIKDEEDEKWKFGKHHWLITYCIYLGDSIFIFFYLYITKKRKKKIVLNQVKKQEQETLGQENLEQNLEEEEPNKKPRFPTNFIFSFLTITNILSSTMCIFGLC